jgi:hypothetical protein
MIGYPEYIVNNTGLNEKYKKLDIDQVHFLMIIQYDQLPRVNCQQYRTQRDSTVQENRHRLGTFSQYDWLPRVHRQQYRTQREVQKTRHRPGTFSHDHLMQSATPNTSSTIQDSTKSTRS